MQQAVQHSMAHRGASATRTNTRWHPYTPPRSVASGSTLPTPNYASFRPSSNPASSSSSEAYLNTPASSAHSVSPAGQPTSSRSASPKTLCSGASQISKSVQSGLTAGSKAQPAKAGYVALLVDQAVRSLSDIWRPEGIPAVFATSSRIAPLASSSSSRLVPPAQERPCRLSIQLPSPSSPSSQQSPISPLYPGRPESTSTPKADPYPPSQSSSTCEKNLVPIRTFVHEVLRRSKTTCSVLQSALCYIEAVRHRVPDLVQDEKVGKGVRGEPELGDRVVKASEDQSSWELETLIDTDSSCHSGAPTETMTTLTMNTECPLTVPFKDADASQVAVEDPSKRRKTPSKPLPPLPPLPSPLLCPRRTFLAALILASKFLQDRCYSNRAWAKLSGLPAREVGRCERALGEALEWRLWVGKCAIAEESARPVSRSRSEGNIVCSSTLAGGRVNAPGVFPSPPLSDSSSSPDWARALAPPTQRRSLTILRRASTMPDELQIKTSHGVPFAFPTAPSMPGPPIYGPMGFSSFAPSSAASSSFQPTPKLSFTPPSLSDSILDTPSTQYSAAFSPARSVGSNESDSATSTPPYGVPLAQSTSYASAKGVPEVAFHVHQHYTGAAAGPVSDATMWYVQDGKDVQYGTSSMLEICGQA